MDDFASLKSRKKWSKGSRGSQDFFLDFVFLWVWMARNHHFTLLTTMMYHYFEILNSFSCKWTISMPSFGPFLKKKMTSNRIYSSEFVCLNPWYNLMNNVKPIAFTMKIILLLFSDKQIKFVLLLSPQSTEEIFPPSLPYSLDDECSSHYLKSRKSDGFFLCFVS